jgi:hypothetical protein
MDQNIELNRRLAHCASCSKEVESNWDLAFFEYRGPASTVAREHCRCGYYECAHPTRDCRQFHPHGPYDYDLFYCGCRGWD